MTLEKKLILGNLASVRSYLREIFVHETYCFYTNGLRSLDRTVEEHLTFNLLKVTVGPVIT